MSSNAGASRPSKVRQQNISLFPLERAALRLLAERERNNNKSAAVARLIDGAMTALYGRDWRSVAPLDRESRDDVPIVA